MQEFKNQQGFTLMELLIVVAIIGILSAISIPTFTRQLERSREAVDAANIRTAYSQLALDAAEGSEDAPQDSGNITFETPQVTESGSTYTANVQLTQQQDGWQTKQYEDGTLGLPIEDAGDPTARGTAVISITTGGEDEAITTSLEYLSAETVSSSESSEASGSGASDGTGSGR